MSFRLRITLMTVTIIAVLFSAGGAVMIHTTFQTSLNKEEEAAVDTSRMILKMLQMVEEGEEWFNEKDLIAALSDMSVQDTVDSVLLTSEKQSIYQRGNAAAQFHSQDEKTEDNQIYLSYFQTEQGEPYLQTTVKLVLGEKSYYLNIGRNLRYVYEVRDAQMQAFCRTFLVLILVGILFSWVMATFLTKPLHKLQEASREIAQGNLSFRSDIHTGDEIASLSADFDAMAEKLEDNINHLQEAAEQKERFMGAFTHELKTPMTSIIGYADLLRTQKLTKDEEEDALNYIFSEAKRLENMSLKMLDIFVADKNELTLSEESPKELVQYVTEHLSPTLEQSNIFIETKAEEGESLEHLTEAFYRVDKARAREEGSAGLGLALCDKIVKLHYGTMAFASEEGKGTTVTVTLKGGRKA